MRRFLEDFAYFPPPYHVRYSAFVDFFGVEYQETSILVEGDVKNGDFSGYYGSMGDRLDVIWVDGVGYTRTPPADWDQPHGFELAMLPNPFDWLTFEDIEYVGRVSRVGRWLHHMRADWFENSSSWTDADWLGVDAEWIEMEDIELDSSQFEFYVNDDGMPTESTLTIALTGTSMGEEASLQYTYTYIFTSHGQDVTIRAPDTRPSS